MKKKNNKFSWLSLYSLPLPSNINFLWNFGSMLSFCLITQILTGLFLSFHFWNISALAFDSINHMMRDVNNGWWIRLMHANTASLFFFLIYLHIGRNIFYNSFLKKKIWGSGIILLLMLMMTAFIGYVLPWGQMSFWGATVITNLLTSIPYFGTNLTNWIWGGFSVSSATLTRFYSLHFILPFIIFFLTFTHIIFLHEAGSNNPLGLTSNIDKLIFFPYYLWKDTLGFFFMMSLSSSLVLNSPFIFMDPDNFSLANPLSTPPHIQPEWYFLFAYAILRSIPNKLGGVLSLFSSILILLILIFKNPHNLSSKFNPKKKFFFFTFTSNFIFLTYLGACPASEPFIPLAQLSSCIYFFFFLIY